MTHERLRELWRQHAIYGRLNGAYRDMCGTDWFSRLLLDLYTDAERLAEGWTTGLYAVYDEASDALKIGHAKDPAQRIANLQIGNPKPIFLVARCPGTKELEKCLHGWLGRWSLRGEWFAASPEVLAAVSLIVASEDFADDLAAAGDVPEPADSITWMAFEFFEAESLLRRAA